jgi:hypothetical protein
MANRINAPDCECPPGFYRDLESPVECIACPYKCSECTFPDGCLCAANRVN